MGFIPVIKAKEENAHEEREEHDNSGQLVVPRLFPVDSYEPDGHEKCVFQKHSYVKGSLAKTRRITI